MVLRTSFILLAVTFGALLPAVRADQAADDLKRLVEQNRRLEEQLRAQQKTIAALTSQMNEMRAATEENGRELARLRESTDRPTATAAPRGDASVRISGETGFAFFRTGGDGQFPHSTFRVDDAKILVEAKVWRDVYFVGELDLFLREASDDSFHPGELYAEFENLSGRWGADHLLNLRVGRFNTPFGEEYQVRGVVDNPLVSHSVADVWGVDQGLEIYGSAGRLSYVAAVQNGGRGALQDFSSDKALMARIGWSPAPWLSLSGSAMRTGDLTTAGDSLSAVWFGNAFFRAIGAPGSAQRFHADLFEFDAAAHWRSGEFKVTGGRVRLGDDGPASHARDLSYYSIEAQQTLLDGLYGAVRYSGIDAPDGYPLAGFGSAGAYFYNPFAPLTERLHRLSVGLGYRLAPPLVWKFEYAFERGRTVGGEDRDREDLLATEIGMRF